MLPLEKIFSYPQCLVWYSGCYVHPRQCRKCLILWDRNHDGRRREGRHEGRFVWCLFKLRHAALALSLAHTHSALLELFIKLTHIHFGRSLSGIPVSSQLLPSSPMAPPSAVSRASSPLCSITHKDTLLYCHIFSIFFFFISLSANKLSPLALPSPTMHTPPLWPIFWQTFWRRKWKVVGEWARTTLGCLCADLC